jgi:DNA-directed RNA polymerase specialized sigma24 family protein
MTPPLDEIAGDAQWPVRLAEAFDLFRAARASEECREAWERLWALLYFGLLRCARAMASRRGLQEIPDLEDIASKKSLDLLRRAESGALDLSGKEAAEVVAFLSAVARNGLLDVVRKEARNPVLSLGPNGRSPLAADPGGRPSGGLAPRWQRSAVAPNPRAGVESRDFARALRACVEAMPARSMRIWFFRVFLEMSSREIAMHPEVNLKPAHIDVIIHRARTAVTSCLEGKGYTPDALPAGSFTELWEHFCGFQARSRGPDPGAGGGSDLGLGYPLWPAGEAGNTHAI